MNDAPKPSNWPSLFLTACISIFIGAIALQLAFAILEPLVPVLITSGIGVIIVVLAVAVRRAQRRRSEW